MRFSPNSGAVWGERKVFLTFQVGGKHGLPTTVAPVKGVVLYTPVVVPNHFERKSKPVEWTRTIKNRRTFFAMFCIAFPS